MWDSVEKDEETNGFETDIAICPWLLRSIPRLLQIYLGT